MGLEERVPLDALQRDAGLFRGRRPLLQQARPPDDRRERGSQLVRHDGEELVLDPVGLPLAGEQLRPFRLAALPPADIADEERGPFGVRVDARLHPAIEIDVESLHRDRAPLGLAPANGVDKGRRANRRKHVPQEPAHDLVRRQARPLRRLPVRIEVPEVGVEDAEPVLHAREHLAVAHLALRERGPRRRFLDEVPQLAPERRQQSEQLLVARFVLRPEGFDHRHHAPADIDGQADGRPDPEGRGRRYPGKIRGRRDVLDPDGLSRGEHRPGQPDPLGKRPGGSQRRRINRRLRPIPPGAQLHGGTALVRAPELDGDPSERVAERREGVPHRGIHILRAREAGVHRGADLEPALGAQACLDGAQVADKERRIGVAKTDDGEFDGDAPAARMERGHLDAGADDVGLPRREVARHAGAMTLAQLGRHEHVAKQPADGLVAVETERRRRALVEVHEAAGRVHDDDAVERGLQQGLAPRIRKVIRHGGGRPAIPGSSA